MWYLIGSEYLKVGIFSGYLKVDIISGRYLVGIKALEGEFCACDN